MSSVNGKKERVLITGNAGFLGSWLADRLLSDGHEVVGVDNLIGGDRGNVGPNVKFYEGDAADPDLMNQAAQGVNVIYHLACCAHEGLSVFSPVTIGHHVAQTSAGVYVAAANHKGTVRRVIFASSMARYGDNEVPFTESTPPRPKDPYAVGKVASENLFRIMTEAFGIEHVVAVPHNIIGSRQKYDDPFRNVASIFINRMLSGQQPVIYGDGEQRRTFSDVRDCVEPLVRMLSSDIASGEVINIGPGPDDNFCTVNELAKMIAGKLGFDLNPIYLGERPQEVRLATCSDAKARGLLGFNPHHSLSETLDEMIDDIRAKGTKPFIRHLPVEVVNDRTPRPWVEDV